MPKLKVYDERYYCVVDQYELLDIASSIREILSTHPLRLDAREELERLDTALNRLAELAL